jgi:hypothetical protein
MDWCRGRGRHWQADDGLQQSVGRYGGGHPGVSASTVRMGLCAEAASSAVQKAVQVIQEAGRQSGREGFVIIIFSRGEREGIGGTTGKDVRELGGAGVGLPIAEAL